MTSKFHLTSLRVYIYIYIYIYTHTHTHTQNRIKIATNSIKTLKMIHVKNIFKKNKNFSTFLVN